MYFCFDYLISLFIYFARLFEWQNSGRKRRCFLVKYLYLCFDKSTKILRCQNIFKRQLAMYTITKGLYCRTSG